MNQVGGWVGSWGHLLHRQHVLLDPGSWILVGVEVGGERSRGWLAGWFLGWLVAGFRYIGCSKSVFKCVVWDGYSFRYI